ncbi:hypothetical protein FBY31_3827 [Arthrobacter sp. SLBN-100]|nr:hypothetical protein FBY31_3827 [Arthrobacter sp. SLBN-100]
MHRANQAIVQVLWKSLLQNVVSVLSGRTLPGPAGVAGEVLRAGRKIGAIKNFAVQTACDHSEVAKAVDAFVTLRLSDNIVTDTPSSCA